MALNETIEGTDVKDQTGGLHFRKAIPTVVVWLLYYTLVSTLDSNQMIQWWKWEDPVFRALCYFALGLFFLTFAIENKAATEFLKALLSYAYDKKLPLDIKLELIKDRVNQAAGLMIALKKIGTHTGLTSKLGLSAETKAETVIDPKNAGLNPNPFPAPVSIPPADIKK
jgi:hypothetical protein